MAWRLAWNAGELSLNESPSEKEGKSRGINNRWSYYLDAPQ